MTSDKTCLRSLKDTLLEYTVLNFDLLFPFKNDTAEEVNDSASISIFPDFLFDEILERSKDMCWSIKKEHLKPCIAIRERLKWSETSCFRFVDDFSPNCLSAFKTSMHRLDTIKVSVYLNTLSDVDVFKLISKAADTLNDLDLAIKPSPHFIKYMLDNDQYSPKVKALIGECKPLKLKRLGLDASSFMLFPFTLDHDELTMLEHCNFKLTKTFLETLVTFKNLVHLSLSKPYTLGVTIEEAMDAVVSLTGLRQLAFDASVNEFALNRITKHLVNLDVLELWAVSIGDPRRLIAPGRKLMVLNFVNLFCIPEERGAARLALDGLAQRVGNYLTLGSFVTMITTTPTRRLYCSAVESAFDIMSKALDVHRCVEKQLLDFARKVSLDFRSPLRLRERCTSRSSHVGANYNMVQRMLCYGMSISEMRRHPIFKDWVRDYVLHHENTHLARRFLKSPS